MYQDAAEDRLELIAQAITTNSGAITTELDTIEQNQIGTDKRLAVTSERIDSNGNLMLIIELETALLSVMMDILDERSDGKRDRKMRGGNAKKLFVQI
jgi:hypothetical protein